MNDVLQRLNQRYAINGDIINATVCKHGRL